MHCVSERCFVKGRGAPLLRNRTILYSRNPDQYLYTSGDSSCVHGIYCFFHPVTRCTEAEIQRAAMLHRVPGGRRSLDRTGEAPSPGGSSSLRSNRKLKGQRLIAAWPDYSHDYRSAALMDWFTSLYIPLQFIPEEAWDAWYRARMTKDLSNLTSLPGGIEGASRLLMWWRSNLLAYIFQPLPWVMDIVAHRVQQTNLTANSSVIGIHIRRGDKKDADGPPPRQLGVYIELAWQLRNKYGVQRIYISSDDSSAIREEMKQFEKEWPEVLIQESGMPGFWQSSITSSGESTRMVGANAIVDAWMLSQCQYLVVAMDSWFGELAYMLSFAREHLVDARHPDGKKFILGQTNGEAGIHRYLFHNFVP